MEPKPKTRNQKPAFSFIRSLQRAGYRYSEGLVVGLFIVALVPRLVGLRWGLPEQTHYFSFHPDELSIWVAVSNLDLFAGQMNPHFFNYGSFYIYLVYFASLLTQGWGAVSVDPQAPWVGAAWLHIVGRCISALLGAATVPLIYALGSLIYNRAVGLLAALLLTAAPLHVMHSHFMTVDVPLTFLSSLSLLLATAATHRRSLKLLLLAGFTTGLAGATKYSIAPFLLITLGLAAWECGKRDYDRKLVAPTAGLMARVRARLTARVTVGLTAGLTLAASVVGFLLGCPYALLAPSEFWGDPSRQQGFAYEMFVHPRQGHGLIFEGTGNGHWYHLTFNLPAALGAPLAACSLGGLLLTLLRLAKFKLNTPNPKPETPNPTTTSYVPSKGEDTRRISLELALLVFSLVYLLLMGFPKVRFARYLLPLLPVLVLFAALLAVQTYQWAVEQRSLNRLAKAACWLGVVFFACTFAYTIAYGAAIAGLFVKKDTRVAASEWLRNRANPPDTIALSEVPWFYTPPICPFNGGMRTKRLFEEWLHRTGYPVAVVGFDVAKLKAVAPRFYVVSEFEYFDPLRLRRRDAMQFFRYLRKHTASVKEFTNFPTLWKRRIGPKLLPHDMLYVNPTVKVYTLDWKVGRLAG